MSTKNKFIMPLTYGVYAVKATKISAAHEKYAGTSRILALLDLPELDGYTVLDVRHFSAAVGLSNKELDGLERQLLHKDKNPEDVLATANKTAEAHEKFFLGVYAATGSALVKYIYSVYGESREDFTKRMFALREMRNEAVLQDQVQKTKLKLGIAQQEYDHAFAALQAHVQQHLEKNNG